MKDNLEKMKMTKNSIDCVSNEMYHYAFYLPSKTSSNSFKNR